MKRHIFDVQFLLYLFAGLLVVYSHSPAMAQEAPKIAYSDTSFYTFKEIVEMAGRSKLDYIVSELPDTATIEEKPTTVMSNQMYQIETDSGITIEKYSISDSAIQTLHQADSVFRAGDFQSALQLYRNAQQIEPTYHYALTLIGDAFYRMGIYDSAQSYFEHAIDENFDDYDAHWFLGDDLWKLGETERAINEYTVAHILNVNNETIRNVLKSRRQQIDRLWKDWDFKPVYEISRQGDTVSIHTQAKWIGYAFVKAFLENEPGYGKGMCDSTGEHGVSMRTELQAIIANIPIHEDSTLLTQILNDNHMIQFVFYEVIAQKYPDVMMTLPKSDFAKIVEYVNKYH